MKKKLLFGLFLFVLCMQGRASDFYIHVSGTGDTGKEASMYEMKFTILSEEEVKLDAYIVLYNTRPIDFSCPKYVSHEGISYRVTEIGSNAYRGNGLWTYVQIPATVTKIASDFIAGALLNYCEVHPDNPVYSSKDGIMFSKDGKTAFFIPRKIDSERIIPEGVEHINEYAGYELYSDFGIYSTIILPSSLRSIGQKAFYNNYEKVSVIKICALEPPLSGEDVFSSLTYEETILMVPEESLQAYRANSVFGKFQKIQTYPDEKNNPNGLNALSQKTGILEIYSPGKNTLLLVMESDTNLPLYRMDGTWIGLLNLKKGENTIQNLSSGYYLIDKVKVQVK